MWLAWRPVWLAGEASGTQILPLGLLLAVLCWAGPRRTGTTILCLAGALAAVLIAARWPELFRIVPASVQAAVCLALGGMFGRTLLHGRQPLVTRMAIMVHGRDLPPQIVAYTRQVTWLWTLFFVVSTAVALAVLFLPAARPWAATVSAAVLPTVACVFALEYAYRSIRFRWFRHATLKESVLALGRLRTSRPADKG